MSLTEADAARLAMLQAAYDKLIAGTQVAAVRFADGRSVNYTAGDLAVLKAEIDKLNAAAANPCRSRGAIRFNVR
jgi:hypothetical protein